MKRPYFCSVCGKKGESPIQGQLPRYCEAHRQRYNRGPEEREQMRTYAREYAYRRRAGTQKTVRGLLTNTLGLIKAWKVRLESAKTAIEIRTVAEEMGQEADFVAERLGREEKRDDNQ